VCCVCCVCACVCVFVCVFVFYCVCVFVFYCVCVFVFVSERKHGRRLVYYLYICLYSLLTLFLPNTNEGKYHIYVWGGFIILRLYF
jgi:hypothetical protein